MKANHVGHNDAGFGLVETLIAMAIVAVMMAAMFQSISINARATSAMHDRRKAVLVAKSALDAAIVAQSVSLRGVDGSMQWQIVVEPYQPAAGSAPAIDLMTVTVSQAGTPLLRLRSLRIGR